MSSTLTKKSANERERFADILFKDDFLRSSISLCFFFNLKLGLVIGF